MAIADLTGLLSKLFDIEKLPSKVVALVCVVSGTILVLPASLHEKLHTKKLIDEFGQFFGLAFVAATTFLLLNILIWLFGLLVQVWKRFRTKVRLAVEVNRLDHAQISVLREFYLQRKQSIMLPVDQPTVAGLFANGMLIRVGRFGQQSMAGLLYPVEMTTELRSVLKNANLGLPEGEPVQDQEGRFIAERPVFMAEIDRIEHERRGFGGW